MGLNPFEQTQTDSGPVGATVNILGSDLTVTTAVAFNGTAAAFKVVSASEITATVPVGATTGLVKVTTSDRVLVSNQRFRVVP